MKPSDYTEVIGYYEDCLTRHGSGGQANNWKNDEVANTTYDAMLGVVRPTSRQVKLLDFGCGLADLYRRIEQRGLTHIDYTGLDLSQKYIDEAKRNHPGLKLFCADILADTSAVSQFDYVVANGVFTRRHTLSVSEMTDHVQRVLTRLFAKTSIGMAFNTMSQCVDFEGEALYHPRFSDIADFIFKNLSRHFVIHNDYETYACTYYVYRSPSVI
jgi:SAM-dependent methyltransferase